jgi:hypothetical protein
MPSNYNFTDVSLTVGYYSIVIICFVGYLTNVLNILVSMRQEMRKTAMGFYNTIISSFNIVYLVLALFQGSLTSSVYACVLIPYFTRIIYQISTWSNVLVLFDRMILISKKMKSLKSNDDIFNMKKVSIIILALFAIVCVINLPNLFFYLQSQTLFNPLTNSTIVYVSCTSSANMMLIRDTMTIISRVALPLVSEVVINTILIRNLFKLNKITTTVSHNREYRFAKTIIILNVIYGFSNCILATTIIFINIYGYNQTYISTTSDESAIASLAYVCANMLVIFINCDLVFFVNMMTNKKYREEASSWLNKRIYPK